MPSGLGQIYRPVIKTKIYPKIYLRSKTVDRKSEKVKAINAKFREAAKECAGKPLKEFNACIGDKLRK